MVATVIGGVISLSLGQQGPPRLDGLVRERYCLITKVSITPSCVGVGFHESGCTDLPERVQSQAYPGSHRLNAVCDGSQRHTNGVSVPADYSSSLIRLSELRIGCTGYILRSEEHTSELQVT